MIFLWLGVFFLSALGMFLFPVYGAVDSRLWMIILGLGILSNSIGYYRLRTGDESKTGMKMLVFIIPAILGLLAFSFPYSLPCYVLGAGILMSIFFQRKFWHGTVLSGLMLLFQTACIVPYFKVAARYHEVNLFTPFFYMVLKILGITCTYSQDTIFVQTPRSVLQLVTMWEKLGLYFFLTFLAGALVLINNVLFDENRKMKIKNTCLLLASLIIYSIIRYVFLCIVFIDIGKMEIFWEPVIVTISYLPLAFLLSKIIHFKKQLKSPVPVLSFSKNALSSGIAYFLLFFALAGYCWFHDPGTLKEGRILIDEYYSNWEWTDKKLDTKWYGVQSVYNYYNMGDYLRHFYSVETLKQPVTDELLAKYDVFILKTPTRAFSEEEIESIANYTGNGGGIFLIGDHTNVFGTTININPLAKRFGIRFNYDATYNLRTNDLHFHEHNTPFRHPALQEMPYFLFATSCSMQAPLFAEDVMTASNLKTIYLDYSRGGYFPDKKTEQNYTFGLFLQTAGVKYGKGRVLAFSDSTCFSNFYMHIPGKPEYMRGTVNWLNRTNRYDKPVKIICLLTIFFMLGYILYVKIITAADEKAASKGFKGLVLFWGVLGLSAGAFIFNMSARTSYVLPDEHTPMKKVGFETSYCRFNIPDKRLLHKPSIDYHTFYVWIQRLGYVPDLFSLQESFDKFEIAVFVNPEGNFLEADLKKIEDYVINGGRILVIDHPNGKKSTAMQVLNRFGLNIRFDQHQEKAEIYDGSESVGKIKSFAPVEGGNPLLFSKDKKPFFSYVKKGKGIVAAMACSPSFTVKEMGETETVPDKQQRFLYAIEFWVMKSLMKKNFESFADFVF